MDGHWRMGGGEDYKYLFNAWFDNLDWSFDDRVAYVQRWDPPYSWLEYVAWILWPDDFLDPEVEPTETHFSRMSAFGLGTREDWARCFDVDPADYPVAGDVSTRWLDGPRKRFDL